MFTQPSHYNSTINVTNVQHCSQNMHNVAWQDKRWKKLKGVMKIRNGMLVIQNYNKVHMVTTCWERNPTNKNQTYKPLPPINLWPVPASQCIPHCYCKTVSHMAHFKCSTTWQKLTTKTLCIWLLSYPLYMTADQNTLYWLLPYPLYMTAE
jgi:hypothetical protein